MVSIPNHRTGIPNANGLTARKRILIVDDRPNIRNDLKLILTPRGYSVSTAASFNEMKVQLNRLLFDLIVLDVRLDEARSVAALDGTVEDKQQLKESLAEISRHGDYTAVVVITGHATTELVFEVTAGYKELIAGFLDKPLRLEEIIGNIKRGIEKTDGLRAQHIVNNPMINPMTLVKHYFDPLIPNLPQEFLIVLRELLYHDYFPLAPRLMGKMTQNELALICWSRRADLALLLEIGEEPHTRTREGIFTEVRNRANLQLRNTHVYNKFRGNVYALEGLSFEDFWSSAAEAN